jgi:uncharacterized membrane protein HdeD (DUF308 family)
MLVVLARNWWTLVLRGVLAILFGVMAFVWPGLTLGALVLLFGAYAFVDGAFAIAAALAGRTGGIPWWALLVEGLIGIGAGIATAVWPGITALTLLYVIAAWALATGVFEIVAAIRLRREIVGEWVLVLSGVLSILLGVGLALFPGTGALALVWYVGAYAIVFGVLLIALGLRLRGWSRKARSQGVQASVA